MLISVVIPALNEANNIQQTITAARRDYAPDTVEIIVVDGGSTDGTHDLVPPNVLLIHSPRGRAVQMNRGAAASHGKILIFCHADSQLPAGWREVVIRMLSQSGVSGGTFQTLILPERGIIMYIRNRMRYAADWRRMYGDQAQFMTRSTFERVGGFPELPLMEDVEMMRALRQEGQLVRIDHLRVVTSSRRFLEHGFLCQSLMNLWSMFRYLNLGATAEDIARVYRSSREKEI
ncbi:MAG: glycosyltransferase family 2 protein [Chloroflexi bacterium]|nr:glycosyltransferase family 2 protein [Chloroflexota bacterium]